MNQRASSFLFLTLLSVATTAVRAEDSERIFGPWTLRCENAADTAHQSCIMFQNLVLKTGGQPVLQFAIGLAPTDNTPTVLMSLPLGIALPPGITIQIDDGKPATFPVERCQPDGCHAGMKLRDTTIAQLGQGQRLNITFYDGARNPINVPLSLQGFGDSFKALTAATP